MIDYRALGVCGQNIFLGRVISIFFGRVPESVRILEYFFRVPEIFGYSNAFGYSNIFGYQNVFGYQNLAGYWNVFGYLNDYGGGGRNLERRNVERSTCQNFKNANIKMTKDELFDSFIVEFIFFFFYKLFVLPKYLIILPNGKILIFQMVR